MNYLHPARSPCLQCDHIDMDKNCVKCQLCEKRLEYIASIDPESLVLFSRFSYSGGRTRYINRTRATKEEQEQTEKLIRDFVNLFYRLNAAYLTRILDTGNKKPVIVKARRDLIKRIKKRFNAPNKLIANALRMKPATISLALIKSAKAGKGEL